MKVELVTSLKRQVTEEVPVGLLACIYLREFQSGLHCNGTRSAIEKSACATSLWSL